MRLQAVVTGKTRLPIRASSTQKKLSAAQQPRRTSQENFIPVGADGLGSAGRLDFHRRNGPARCHRRHCRSARTGAGRLRFANAALEKARPHIVPAVDRDELDIHAVWKVRVALDFRSLRLPVRWQTQERKITKCGLPIDTGMPRTSPVCSHLQSEFIFDHGFAHFDFKFVFGVACARSAGKFSCLRRSESKFVPCRVGHKRKPPHSACRCPKFQPRSRRR